ncbi:MAG: cupin domain-containing protein [Thermomicrobiales bacterium]|nr:cupin domain-containing protein [Thermomicrobiales bacterium]MCO5222134.1 cupin domain-containing protein [Thermomicrobiales bacterium]
MAKREHLAFETLHLPADVDVLAPDTSEIRELLHNPHASMAHGTLPAGSVSVAIKHKTVHEIWYILGGEGELWRRSGHQEEVVHLRAGVVVTIPVQVAFQFRALGDESLRFLMCTSPPWPGHVEAVLVEGHWELPES